MDHCDFGAMFEEALWVSVLINLNHKGRHKSRSWYLNHLSNNQCLFITELSDENTLLVWNITLRQEPQLARLPIWIRNYSLVFIDTRMGIQHRWLLGINVKKKRHPNWKKVEELSFITFWSVKLESSLKFQRLVRSWLFKNAVIFCRAFITSFFLEHAVLSNSE